MSILQALRGYLAGCPCLGALTGGIKTDWTDEAGDYALMPSGQVELARYMDGTRLMRYQCFLTARRFTQADLERVENAEFFEDFSRWIAGRGRRLSRFGAGFHGGVDCLRGRGAELL